jgi:hypothetical protein
VTINYKLVYLMAALAGIACIVGIWMSDDVTARDLSEEDALVQTLSAVAWAGGMVCCAIAILRGSFVRWAWLWLLLCLVFMGEETSWFQRYLHYSVPVVEQASNQAEFNVHNLGALPDGLAQGLFMLGMFGYFLALPVALTRASFRAFAARVGFPDPTIALGLAMWVPVALSYLPVVPRAEVHHAVVETREMLVACYVLLYVFGFAIRHAGAFSTWPPFGAPRATPPGTRRVALDV